MTKNLQTEDSKDDDEMSKYGITRHQVDYYHFGIFRYTSLKDAVAQARRTLKTGKS